MIAGPRIKISSKTIKIHMLGHHQRLEIKNKLKETLAELGYVGNELRECIEKGVSGRLCDLEDTIDIYDLKAIRIK